MTAAPDRHAVVDIGSSTLKYAIYDRGPAGFVLHRESDPWPTGLGRGLRPGGPLDPEARRRSLDALAVFRDEIREAGARLALVVATEAVRRTGDREAFVAEVATLMGPDAPVRVVSGETEAHWALRSAEVGLGLGDGADLLSIDPGGSSTDCARRGADGAPQALSLPFGMNSMMAIAPPERDAGRLSAAETAELSAFLEQRAAELADWLGADIPDVIVGTSGAALALGTVSRGGPPGSREERARAAHGHRVRLAEIEHWIEVEAPASAEERRTRHPGLTPLRAQIFVHGALAWRALLRGLGREELIVNGWGMKLGALAEIHADPNPR